MLVKNSLQEALEEVRPYDHIALLYESRQDQYAAVLPFFQIGLDRGEYCIYIADDATQDEVIKEMTEFGIDTELYLNAGALAVVGKKETYLRNGVFDPEEMIRFIEMAIKSAKAGGFANLRGAGDATWALSEKEGLERAIDYEVKFDRVIRSLDIQAVCMYNLKRFPSETILDVIRTHPRIIYKGKLCENDFYVPQTDIWSADRTKMEVNRQLERLYTRSVGA